MPGGWTWSPSCRCLELVVNAGCWVHISAGMGSSLEKQGAGVMFNGKLPQPRRRCVGLPRPLAILSGLPKRGSAVGHKHGLLTAVLRKNRMMVPGV